MEKREIKVRLFQEKDREAIRDICHKTALAPMFVENKEFVCTCYADPYMDICPGSLFVAANEADEAVGYLMVAPDTKAFRKAFKKGPYLKKLRKMGLSKWLMMKFVPLGDFGVLKNYPAHLHIDIYDGYQRMGIGHKLMDAAFEYLHKNNIKGIHLGVSSSNTKGVPFYEKYGFEVYKRLPGNIIFCKNS